MDLKLMLAVLVLAIAIPTAYASFHNQPDCPIGYSMYEGVCEPSPHNFYYNIISVDSNFINNELVSTVVYQNNFLPAEELGKNYYVSVQPSQPYAMFYSSVDIIAEMGTFNVTIIESRPFNDKPTEVYAWISKNVTSGAPYASNFLYAPIGDREPCYPNCVPIPPDPDPHTHPIIDARLDYLEMEVEELEMKDVEQDHFLDWIDSYLNAIYDLLGVRYS